MKGRIKFLDLQDVWIEYFTKKDDLGYSLVIGWSLVKNGEYFFRDAILCDGKIVKLKKTEIVDIVLTHARRKFYHFSEKIERQRLHKPEVTWEEILKRFKNKSRNKKERKK